MTGRIAQTLTVCFALGALTPSTGCTPKASVVRNDEVVTPFPVWARQAGDGAWEARLHGWIYEPEEDSALRGMAVESLRKAFGVEAGDVSADVFRRRARSFLVDNERGKRLTVDLAGRRIVLPPSEPNGHFAGDVKLAAKEAEGAVAGQLAWSVTAADGRRFEGRIQLIAPEGLSVVSDIDDTVKVTEVTDKRKLVENTFLKEFSAVPGMAPLYRRWAAKGAAFHFVSSSPWQLYPELATFLERAGFPPATFHLKRFRIKDSTVFDLLKSGARTKPEQIRPLLDAFPKRRFYLVGDSGEQDPEVYGALARERPDQVRHVFIRNVTGEVRDSARFQAAFAGVAVERWTLFSWPEEIARDR